MNRPRVGRQPGWLLIVVLAWALCGTAAACSGSGTTTINNQVGSNCADQGSANRNLCAESSGTGSNGSAHAEKSQQKPNSPLQLLGRDPMFDDPALKSALAKLGFTVQALPPDSRPTDCRKDVTAIRGYDLSTSSEPQAQCYQSLATRAGERHGVFYPYHGMLVIATYKPIVALLEQLRIARDVNGVIVFDVAKYLRVFSSGMRWTDIKGNAFGNPRALYPNSLRILLWTTDPKNSNLGEMSAALDYAAQNGGVQPISVSRSDPRVKVIGNLYTELGRQGNNSNDLVDEYFDRGMSAVPMAMMYEDQYLNGIVRKRNPDPTRAFMYPTPNATIDDALVGFTARGSDLVSVVQSGNIANILESEGFRAANDTNTESGFIGAMARQHLIVPSGNSFQRYGIQISQTPTGKALTELISAVEADENQ